MSGEEDTKYFHVNAVGPVDGPVGMDLGIWLNFDTEQGKIRVKLEHADALALQKKLKAEKSLSAAKTRN